MYFLHRVLSEPRLPGAACKAPEQHNPTHLHLASNANTIAADNLGKLSSHDCGTFTARSLGEPYSGPFPGFAALMIR